MPTVTVAGANNQVVSLNYSVQDAVAAAQSLANTIQADVQSGAMLPVNYDGSVPPATTSGALFVSTSEANVTQPVGYNTVVLGGGGTTAVQGSASSFVRVLADSGNLSYTFGSGSSGTVVAGDGNNYITTGPTSTGGLFNVIVGAGTNTIALEGGSGKVATGAGSDSISLGTGNVRVYAGGSATIAGSSVGTAGAAGSDTINAGGGTLQVWGLNSNLTFVGGSGSATVIGGAGSDTIVLNQEMGVFQAGTGGNSLLVGGDMGATLIGTANGDELVAGSGRFATAAAPQVLIAGPGNETLQGGGATGPTEYFAGNNATVGGATFYAQTSISASDHSTVFGSTGFSTVTGSGNVTYEFVNGQAGGGMETITNFDPTVDSVRLYNYGAGAVAAAVQGATVNPPGTTGTVVTLSDNTRILFQGYTGGFNGNTIA